MTEQVSAHLQKSEIIQHFKNLDFNIAELSQPWRHIVGKVKRDGKEYFLKLATTPEISKRTKNEYEWNKLINSRYPLPVRVPISYESGEYRGVFWFISEYVSGQDLASPLHPEDTERLIKALPTIAQTAQAICSFPTDTLLPRDVAEEKVTTNDKILGKMENWQKQIKTDVSSLIAFAAERMQCITSTPQHGDFVPWHFRQTTDGKLYLYDAEAAAMRGIKFYDIAYFYHRVYTKLKRPDIAQVFLQEVENIISMDEDDTECLRVVLAQRVVGGYFDAERDNITSIELQDSMSKELLEGKII